MSFQAIRWVMERSQHKNTTLLVQLILADYANDEGLAWPSRDTIGERVGVGRSTVSEALKRLRDSGDIKVERPGGTATQKTTMYRLPLLAGGGVRQAGQEPPEKPSTSKSSSSSSSSDCYSEGSCPPDRTGVFEQLDLPEDVQDEILGVCKFLADELVRVGKKQAKYALTDASSDRWLELGYKLWSERFFGDCQRLGLAFSDYMKPIMTFILDEDTYAIRDLADLHNRAIDEAQAIVHADRVPSPRPHSAAEPSPQRRKTSREYYVECFGEPENWDSITLGEPRKRRTSPDGD